MLRECRELSQALNVCVRPAVFFEKYDALESLLKELTAYEKYRVFQGNTPSRDLRRLQDQEQSEINAMIQRSFTHARDRAAELPPEDKRRAMSEYFDDIDAWSARMSRFNKKVVRDLRKIVMEKA